MFLPTDLKVCHFHYFLYTWKPHWHQWIYHMLGDEYLKQIFWHDRPYALNLRGPLDSKIVWANAIQVKIKLKPFKSSLNSFFSTSFLWRICSCWSFFCKKLANFFAVFFLFPLKICAFSDWRVDKNRWPEAAFCWKISFYCHLCELRAMHFLTIRCI